eukprot:9132991-Ditylum_brightwellii.AAC.1
MVTALSDKEEKQEENEGVMLSSESEDLMDWTSCGVFVKALLSVALEGVLLAIGMGTMGRRTEKTLVSRCLVRLSCLLMVREEEDLMAQ